jgi:preprotein translocase subunit SecG
MKTGQESIVSLHKKFTIAFFLKPANIILINMATILPVLQIILSVLLVAGIILQNSSAGLGGAFGGSDNADTGFHTRRGFEKWLFNGTIVLAILFAIVSILSFVLSS